MKFVKIQITGFLNFVGFKSKNKKVSYLTYNIYIYGITNIKDKLLEDGYIVVNSKGEFVFTENTEIIVAQSQKY